MKKALFTIIRHFEKFKNIHLQDSETLKMHKKFIFKEKLRNMMFKNSKIL